MIDRRIHPCKAAILTLALASVSTGQTTSPTPPPPPAAPLPAIPDAFPRFIVPGAQPQMDTLRAMFHHHYMPGTHLATPWIEWMSSSTLWPAVGDEAAVSRNLQAWREGLEFRKIDAEGYVSTHQHPGQGHADGWPFPLWVQGGGIGWHFSLKEMPYQEPFGVHKTTPAGFQINGGTDAGVDDDGWRIHLAAPGATLTTPAFSVSEGSAPWLKILWRTKGLAGSQCFVEWMGEGDRDFSAAKRVYFTAPGDADGFTYAMIPVHQHPAWKGKIARLRFGFPNTGPADVHLRYIATAFDTRHNVNNASFIQGCCNYFNWTGDTEFLRKNLPRVRLALRYCMETLGVRAHHCVVTPWVGHDGRSGLVRSADGKKRLINGTGIGNNYWDLLPFGGQDALATVYVYDAINRWADIEALVEAHPEWNLPASADGMKAQDLRRQAADIKRVAGAKFWNDKTGRFVAAIDADGVAHDYGFTFLNLEAIHYGLATPDQARQIMAWIDGERTVAGDTSTGSDIYHWRFAPRATTRRNIDYYCWVWSGPESIPFGGQVQDGGAVLGFSYHDLMARIDTLGPDDAWRRLQEILAWWDEVQAAGGYRAYYKDGTRGTLQGGGTAGGLGLDQEFAESILVPQVMLYGFLGARPVAGGIEIRPRLPHDWPSLTVSRIEVGGRRIDVSATPGRVTLMPAEPGARWQSTRIDAHGKPLPADAARSPATMPNLSVEVPEGGSVLFMPLPR